jgi:hypothetical protein
MKKILLTLTLVFLFSIITKSQFVHFVGGLSFSYMSIDFADFEEYYSSSPVMAPNLGIMYEQMLLGNFSVMPGILINKQGKKLSSEAVSGYFIQSKYLISYIEVPLIFTYYLDRARRTDPYFGFSFGPSYSYGYYGLYNEDDGGIYDEENLFVGSNDLYRSNFSAIAMFTAGTENHRFSVYVSPGIRKINQPESELFNTVRTLSAGITYHLVMDINPKKSRFLLNKLFR